MAVDCAHELKKHNVACVSLWPGAVQTETIMENIASGKTHTDPATGVSVRIIISKYSDFPKSFLMFT